MEFYYKKSYLDNVFVICSAGFLLASKKSDDLKFKKKSQLALSNGLRDENFQVSLVSASSLISVSLCMSIEKWQQQEERRNQNSTDDIISTGVSCSCSSFSSSPFSLSSFVSNQTGFHPFSCRLSIVFASLSFIYIQLELRLSQVSILSIVKTKTTKVQL